MPVTLTYRMLFGVRAPPAVTSSIKRSTGRDPFTDGPCTPPPPAFYTHPNAAAAAVARVARWSHLKNQTRHRDADCVEGEGERGEGIPSPVN